MRNSLVSPRSALHSVSPALILPLVLSVASACATRPPDMGSRAMPESVTGVAIRRDDNSATVFQGSSGIAEAERLLIRNEADWQSAWKRLVANVSPQPSPPAIDFSHDMVLLAALGARPTTGYGIHIAHVGRTAGVTYVEVRTERPGKRCRPAQRTVTPADVAVVPQLNEPVTFVEVDSVVAC